MALDMKGLDFVTEWVEFCDIKDLYERLGLPPSPADATGGRGPHTLPVIYDPSTGAIRSDSAQIIQYLDKTYPHTHRLFPEGTTGLQLAFDTIIFSLTFYRALRTSMFYLSVPQTKVQGELNAVPL